MHRPQLSARAATRLARFVADNLLQVLDQRADFDAETKAAVAAVVRRRVEDAGADMVEFRRGGRTPPPGPTESIKDRLQRQFAEGKLNDQIISDALAVNDGDFVLQALAILARVSLDRVNKIIGTQSAKGIVSLGWKAGLSMQTAVALQTKLAKIQPADLLRPRPGFQAFPLTTEEMEWQLEFFASMVGDIAG